MVRGDDGRRDHLRPRGVVPRGRASRGDRPRSRPGILAYVAVLVAGGRRPYDGSNRLEASAATFALAAVTMAVLPIHDDLAVLDFRALVVLVLALMLVGSSVSMVIGQGWRPSAGVALLVLGAALLFAARLEAIDGTSLNPAPWFELPALLVLLAGTLVGDHGMPAPDRRRVSLLVMVVAIAAAIAVLAFHGSGRGGDGEIADGLAILVLMAAFGRAISPAGSVARTDPSELGGIDRLTGLPDRYELEAVLERELQYAGHRNMPVALAVLDLDQPARDQRDPRPPGRR